MEKNSYLRKTFLTLIVVVASGLAVPEAFAHCDTLDGPVIAAAREALRTGDVKPVLAWVQLGDEAQLKGVFQKTLAVRKLNPEAREFADTYFFETLVRIHRAGEGAPYTGLKPAGQVEPAVAIADNAIGSGSADLLEKELSAAVHHGVQERFTKLMEKKKHAKESVDSGREYVAAYVDFVHYVERVHESAVASAHAHHGEGSTKGGVEQAPQTQAAHEHKAGHDHK